MARNQEKAQSMLYRFREAEMAELGFSTTIKRPTHTSMSTTLQEAEKWRGHVIRDITRKVTRIHDPGLNESQIRELNDEINKLFKEKWQWERKILEFGGTDYSRAANRTMIDGKELPGMKGYKYFGRARELPEVKELFEKMSMTSSITDKIKFDRSRLDADYFGYLDDLDLLSFEKEKEKELSQLYLNELEKEEPINKSLVDPLMQQLYDGANELNLEFVHQTKDVEDWMLEKRKQELLNKFLNT